MKNPIITDEFVTVATIANAIHYWLHKMGDEINQYTNGVDRVFAIQQIVQEALKESKKVCEENKDRLNGNIPKWTAKIMFDVGYKMQCLVLEPFEAATEEEARIVVNNKLTAFFEKEPNAEIFEIKIRKAT